MSRYMPYSVVLREYMAQQVRREYGLKSGFYVKYPDREKGPYVIKASQEAHIMATQAALDLEKEQNNEQKD